MKRFYRNTMPVWLLVIFWLATSCGESIFTSWEIEKEGSIVGSIGGEPFEMRAIASRWRYERDIALRLAIESNEEYGYIMDVSIEKYTTTSVFENAPDSVIFNEDDIEIIMNLYSKNGYFNYEIRNAELFVIKDDNERIEAEITFEAFVRNNSGEVDEGTESIKVEGVVSAPLDSYY